METTPSPLPSEELTILTEQVRQQVADGYTSPDQIVVNLAERFEIPAHDSRRPVLVALVREAIADHQRQQAGWPALTDCDRLDRAFASLEAAGVVARAHFTCCQSCARSEIGGEVATVRARGREVRGHVFFHAQDTERAVAGHGLLLGYGPVGQPSPAATEAIGHVVVEALREAGLQPVWNGSAAQRIAVPLRWQRRRAERMS